MTTSTATLEKRSSFPVGTIVLIVLVLIGVWAAIIRYTQGLGASTNLNDTTTWGLWIAFDVMSGVALAAGGFTLAAVITASAGFGLRGFIRSRASKIDQEDFRFGVWGEDERDKKKNLRRR